MWAQVLTRKKQPWIETSETRSQNKLFHLLKWIFSGILPQQCQVDYNRIYEVESSVTKVEKQGEAGWLYEYTGGVSVTQCCHGLWWEVTQRQPVTREWGLVPLGREYFLR